MQLVEGLDGDGGRDRGSELVAGGKPDEYGGLIGGRDAVQVVITAGALAVTLKAWEQYVCRMERKEGTSRCKMISTKSSGGILRRAIAARCWEG